MLFVFLPFFLSSLLPILLLRYSFHLYIVLLSRTLYFPKFKFHSYIFLHLNIDSLISCFDHFPSISLLTIPYSFTTPSPSAHPPPPPPSSSAHSPLPSFSAHSPLPSPPANNVPMDGKAADGNLDMETPDTMPGEAPHQGNQKKMVIPERDEGMSEGKSVLQGKLTKLAIQIGYAGQWCCLSLLIDYFYLGKFVIDLYICYWSEC